jgi:predicted ArsR family transcriptional regulator
MPAAATRADRLATTLSDAGFAASIEPTTDGFRLVQNHCAIAQVAKEHPEVCAYEAAAFSQVLGRDVSLSRRDTLVTGASACVCTVEATSSSAPADATPAVSTTVWPGEPRATP